MFDNIQVTTEDITPERAEMILRKWYYPLQRKKLPHQVEYLGQEMRAGRFLSYTTLVVAQLPPAHEDGETRHFLLDGQHRLEAVLQADLTLPFTFHTYQVETEEEVAEIYYRTDIGRRRTKSDLFRVTDFSEKSGITPYLLRPYSSAVSLLLRKFVTGGQKASLSHDKLLQACEEYLPEAHGFLQAIYGGDSNVNFKLRTVPAFAVALLAFREDAEKAMKFYNTISQNSGLVKGTIEHIFVHWLFKHSSQRRDARDAAGTMAYLWCKYTKGETIQKLSETRYNPLDYLSFEKPDKKGT